MGMIRRSLAFPPRARNKAAGGRAKGGGNGGGLTARLPLSPPPVRGPGPAGMGAGSLKSSDSGRRRRAPGHPPGQVQFRTAASGTSPPPAPPCPSGSACSGGLREPLPSGRKRNTKRPRGCGTAGLLWAGGDGTHSPGFLGVGGWRLSGGAARLQGELKHA